MADLSVGDVLTTEPEVRGCPVGTILMSEFTVARKTSYPSDPWEVSGRIERFDSSEMIRVAEWTVVWLPPPPPITEVTFETEVDAWSDGDGAFLVDEVKSYRLLEPLVGKAVVVTVRVKEADDAT